MIVDPQPFVRNVLREKLEFEGYKAEAARTLEEANEKHKADPCSIVIYEAGLAEAADISSPGMELFSDASHIIMGGSPAAQAVAEEARGKVDFVTKPIDMNYLLGLVRNITGERLNRRGAAGAVTASPDAAAESRHGGEAGSVFDDIVGNSTGINHVKSLIEKVAPSNAKVLITGASGTGKEQVANWLHRKSPRREGPYIKVNCAAIPSELIESELFGHEKGAFTSAIRQRKGKFEQADGGTLFLDEIGDMSLSAQAKVLRVLQEKKICRVGSDKEIDIDVRVVAATNKNLSEEIEKGSFREDLFHRLNVIVIDMPPLADRLDDIPLLAAHFANEICGEYGMSVKDIDGEAVAELMGMDWKGNIRELRNVVERLVILCGDMITADDVRRYARGTM